MSLMDFLKGSAAGAKKKTALMGASSLMSFLPTIIESMGGPKAIKKVVPEALDVLMQKLEDYCTGEEEIRKLQPYLQEGEEQFSIAFKSTDEGLVGIVMAHNNDFTSSRAVSQFLVTEAIQNIPDETITGWLKFMGSKEAMEAVQKSTAEIEDPEEGNGQEESQASEQVSDKGAGQASDTLETTENTEEVQEGEGVKTEADPASENSEGEQGANQEVKEG